MTNEPHRSSARAAVMERRRCWVERMQGELTRMVDVLRIQKDVERVMVFGSVGRGQPRLHSDLDLVVVRRTNRRFVDRIEDTLRLLRPRVSTDVLVYTPEEWAQMRLGSALGRRVEREGKVLYAADAHE